MMCRRWLASGGWVMMVCVLGISAGCGESARVKIDHSDPKALTVSVQQAVMEHDYAAVIGAMDSNFRSPFNSLVSAMRSYVHELSLLADAVETHIGPQQAQRFDQLAERVYFGTLPPPLEAAMEDGKVNWDKVAFLDEGDWQAVMIRDRTSRFDKTFVLVPHGNQWYLAPRMKNIDTEWFDGRYKKGAQAAAKEFKAMTDAAKDLRQKVETGVYNKDNFDEKMAELRASKMGGMSGTP